MELKSMHTRKAYFMTQINNMHSIFNIGLLSYNKVHNNPELLKNHKSIANKEVNSRRHKKIIGGIPLHDYVALYVAIHTPMQSVISVHDEELILIEFCLNKLEKNYDDLWSTDGNAASDKTSFHKGLLGLQYMDWKIINTRNCWGHEYKRKKAAEILVPNKIPISLFNRIIVFNETAKNSIKNIITQHNVEYLNLIDIDDDFFY